MLHRPLGATGLTVSALGFGVRLVDSGRLDERSARVLLETAIKVWP